MEEKMLVVQITGAWKYNYIITSEVFPASFFFHWERKSCHVSRLNFRIKIFWSYEREEKTIASDWWMLLVKITELVSHFAHNLCSFKPFLCSLIPFSQTQSSFFCLSGQRLLFFVMSNWSKKSLKFLLSPVVCYEYDLWRVQCSLKVQTRERKRNYYSVSSSLEWSNAVGKLTFLISTWTEAFPN